MTTHLENCEWKCTPDVHFGTENEIHIWRIPVKPVQETELKVLSSDERKRLAEFRNTLSKNIYFSSRIMMRKLFSSYLDLPASDIEIAIHSQGKPYLKMNDNSLEFNLTHSDTQVLLAISNNGAIGIDVETARPVSNWGKIANKVFDQVFYNSLMNTDKPEKQFISYWTVFEARQKLFGHGVFGSSQQSNNIKTITFEPEPGFHAALAFEAESPTISFFSALTTDVHI